MNLPPERDERKKLQGALSKWGRKRPFVVHTDVKAEIRRTCVPHKQCSTITCRATVANTPLPPIPNRDGIKIFSAASRFQIGDTRALTDLCQCPLVGLEPPFFPFAQHRGGRGDYGSCVSHSRPHRCGERGERGAEECARVYATRFRGGRG